MQYAIFAFQNRQYFIKPGQVIEVDGIKESKTVVSNKVLLIVDEDKLEIGKPYLDRELRFEVVSFGKKPKLRVATYKAKSNYHRVKGSRAHYSKIKLVD